MLFFLRFPNQRTWFISPTALTAKNTPNTSQENFRSRWLNIDVFHPAACQSMWPEIARCSAYDEGTGPSLSTKIREGINSGLRVRFRRKKQNKNLPPSRFEQCFNFGLPLFRHTTVGSGTTRALENVQRYDEWMKTLNKSKRAARLSFVPRP